LIDLGIACGGYAYKYICVNCNEITEVDVRDYYCSWSHIGYDDVTGATICTCISCGTEKREFTEKQYTDPCHYTTNYNKQYFVAGELVLTGISKSYTEEHKWQYEFTLNGTSCDDGYTVKEYCQNCDRYNEWTGAGHSTYRVEYYDFTQYGACRGYLEKYTCACGANQWTNTDYCAHSTISNETYVDENGEKQTTVFYNTGNTYKALADVFKAKGNIEVATVYRTAFNLWLKLVHGKNAVDIDTQGFAITVAETN
jgi:hypothetical protein